MDSRTLWRLVKPVVHKLEEEAKEDGEDGALIVLRKVRIYVSSSN
jgi:hypothetical protein